MDQGLFQFRLFLFDGDRERGERMARAVLLGSTTEADAIAEADQLRQHGYAELWQGEQVVRIFEPD